MVLHSDAQSSIFGPLGPTLCFRKGLTYQLDWHELGERLDKREREGRTAFLAESLGLLCGMRVKCRCRSEHLLVGLITLCSCVPELRSGVSGGPNPQARNGLAAAREPPGFELHLAIRTSLKT